MTSIHPTPRPWKVLRPILRLSHHVWLARLVILVVHLVVLGGGYRLVLRVAEARGISMWDSSSWIDYWIPPTPWAFWVYATLYLYFPITMLMSPRTREGIGALLLHLQAQILLSLLTWCIFLVCPTEIHIREQMELAVQGSTPMLQEAYRGLYQLDARWNAWPSLHVSLSLLMVLACTHFATQPGTRGRTWLRAPRDRWVLALGALAWIALCWSILATKQHFFFDLWTGALAGLLTWLVYLRPRLRSLGQRAQEG